MFVQSAKFIQAHSCNRNNISVYGQEANADTWKMAKIRYASRKQSSRHSGIRHWQRLCGEGNIDSGEAEVNSLHIR